MIKNKFIISIALLTLFHHSSFIIHNCSYAAFLRPAGGGRPTAMGGAFIAVSDDVNAIIYNPGGLSLITYPEINVMYAKLYNGLDSVNLGLKLFSFALPIDEQTGFGFAWSNFSSANEYQEDTFLISYGYRLSGMLTGGLNVKYLGHKYVLDERTRADPVFEKGDAKYGVTLDAGVVSIFELEGDKRSISAGFVARNIIPADVGIYSTDIVPAEIGLGAAYRFGGTILPAIDITYRFQDWGKLEDKINIRGGAETWLMDHLFCVRGGFAVSDISLGFAFNPQVFERDLQFDYSFLLPLEIEETTGTHYLSMSLRFPE